MSSSAKLARNHPLWFDELPEVLSQAVEDYHLADTSDWEPMDELSSQTLFEGIEVYGDAAIVEKNSEFVAPGTVYVKLQYDPNSNEPVTFSDSYPARVRFVVTDKSKKSIEIKGVEVDNSSFYE